MANRQMRTFSVGKVRNLLNAAGIALKDARAPAQYVSASRRFDAAYDAVLCCALAICEATKQEVYGDGHHREVMQLLVGTLKLKGQNTEGIGAMIGIRNRTRYDGAPVGSETVVQEAIAVATRVIAETEGWMQTNCPLALKS